MEERRPTEEGGIKDRYGEGTLRWPVSHDGKLEEPKRNRTGEARRYTNEEMYESHAAIYY